MRDSNDPEQPLGQSVLKKHFPLITGAVACILFGVVMASGVYWMWQMENTPVTGDFRGRVMHRKTRTMNLITDGLVRGELRRVQSSAETMWEIGQTLNWYLSSDQFEDNNRIFRDSTRDLVQAARQRDHDAAKEAALRLERSCIECHALINR
jgi:hypothetical protein